MTEPARSARIPGDHGLPGLGLAMQLASGLEGLVVIAMAFAVLQAPVNAGPTLWVLLAITLARALVAFIAGMELRAGGMNIPSRVRALLVVSVVHFAALLWPQGSQIGLSTIWTCAQTLMWPALLFGLLQTPAWRQRFQELREGAIELRDENRSIESVGALMVTLGTAGVILTGAILWFLVEGSPSGEPPRVSLGRHGGYGSHPAFTTFFPWLSLAAGVMLLRGLLHVAIGVRAMAGATPERFSRDVGHYVRLHWLTVVVAVVPIAYAFTERVPYMGILAFAVATTFSVWPMVLRGFAVQVAGEFGEQEASDFARAPDGGLATAGWLLCGLAASSIVPAGLALLAVTRGTLGLEPLSTLSWFESDALPVGSGIVGVAITLWAGLEMIRMTPRARIAALVFAVFTLVVTLWIRLEWLTSDAIGTLETRSIPASFLMVTTIYRAQILLSLIVPLMVAFLALRRPAAGKAEA